MKVGSKIRVQYHKGEHPIDIKDYTIEEFRYCLGFFESEQDRKANRFTPLCELYERGPDSKSNYIPNYGEYYTNPVQGWMDIG